jgi:hypothetical protein
MALPPPRGMAIEWWLMDAGELIEVFWIEK